jgi:DNA-binding NarL/FixJ family response regulator
MEPVKILIAEGHDIYRHGISSIFRDNGKFVVLHSGRTGQELLNFYEANRDAICLISSNIPDSNVHNIMQELREINRQVRAVVLTHSTELSHLNQALKAGVKGYLSKNVSAEELINVTLDVASGKQAFGKSISQIMIGKYTDIAKRSSSSNKKGITKREREVLKLIVEGHTSSEIADVLFISTRTVETHRSNLMNKLELKNTAALVRYAIEEEYL